MTKFAPKAIRQPHVPAVKAAKEPKPAKTVDGEKPFIAQANKKTSPLGKAFAAYKPASVKAYPQPRVSRTSS